jgi:peroxiredoxin family protein
MDETNEATITDELKSLRSILRSDDHLQIQPSGDYEQVRITLDQDVQISFFFDSLNVLTKRLTTNNVSDLRINKSSSKCPLDNDQWTNIRKYFDELVQQSKSDTSLHSIIQLIQDRLLQMKTTTRRSKQKQRKTDTTAEDTSMTTSTFRGGDLIFNRILHDKTIDRSQVVIGYEDRFTGIHEIPFNEFKKVHDHEVISVSKPK